MTEQSERKTKFLEDYYLELPENVETDTCYLDLRLKCIIYDEIKGTTISKTWKQLQDNRILNKETI